MYCPIQAYITCINGGTSTLYAVKRRKPHPSEPSHGYGYGCIHNHRVLHIEWGYVYRAHTDPCYTAHSAVYMRIYKGMQGAIGAAHIV